jgi:dethiobiotin synthetase
MNYFVTAIGTDSGKTLVSAILCEAFKSDYWKPIQAGFPRDAEMIKSLVSNGQTKIWPETYLLDTPASPHASAKIDRIQIELNKFIPPVTDRLIVEGAGGCLVPINDHDFVIDIAKSLNFEIILVANLYLGSINHTLLTANYLKQNNYKVKGIIFNGDSNPESERIILEHTAYPLLLSIQKEVTLNKDVVQTYSKELLKNMNI